VKLTRGLKRLLKIVYEQGEIEGDWDFYEKFNKFLENIFRKKLLNN
jgi:hypothetical protein